MSPKEKATPVTLMRAWRRHVAACDGGLPKLISTTDGMTEFGVTLRHPQLSNAAVRIKKTSDGRPLVVISATRLPEAPPAVTNLEELAVIARNFPANDDGTGASFARRLALASSSAQLTRPLMAVSLQPDYESGWHLAAKNGCLDDLVLSLAALNDAWPNALYMLRHGGEDITNQEL